MCETEMHSGAEALHDLLQHVDEAKQGNLPIDHLWHEREAFGSVLCSLDIDDEIVFTVIQQRIDQLKKERSAALDAYSIDIEGKSYLISLADLLICNWACIRASFEDAVQNEEMSTEELDNVQELADRIAHANELLEAVGVKQHLSEEVIDDYFQDIVENIAKQTTEYALAGDEDEDGEEYVEEEVDYNDDDEQ